VSSVSRKRARDFPVYPLMWPRFPPLLLLVDRRFSTPTPSPSASAAPSLTTDRTCTLLAPSHNSTVYRILTIVPYSDISSPDYWTSRPRRQARKCPNMEL